MTKEELLDVMKSVRFALIGTGNGPPDQLEACQYNTRNAVHQIDTALGAVKVTLRRVPIEEGGAVYTDDKPIVE